MNVKKEMLWPYSKTVAILAIPIIWGLFVILFSLTHRYMGWPDPASRNVLIYIAIGISVIPLALVLLEFASSKRAILDIKGIKIDFSQATEIRREPFGLPDNIGVSETILSDTTPMEILSALQQATLHEIVRVDIKDGSAWWVTRLLALSAGAVRAGAPQAFVFVGRKSNVDGAFLGSAAPSLILKAILADNEEYRSAYHMARAIAGQVKLFGDDQVQPPQFDFHHNVIRYTGHGGSRDYASLGDAAFEQIFMDQLATTIGLPGREVGKSLEDPPDRLTLGRLTHLFAPDLYPDAIDLAWSNEKQVSTLLSSRAPYVALLRNGKYESMLKRDEGERLILRELYSQLQQGQ